MGRLERGVGGGRAASVQGTHSRVLTGAFRRSLPHGGTGHCPVLPSAPPPRKGALCCPSVPHTPGHPPLPLTPLTVTIRRGQSHQSRYTKPRTCPFSALSLPMASHLRANGQAS